MKEQIRELRVRIDGLAQLTSNLKNKKTQVDIALKTNKETIDEFLDRVESEKLGIEIVEQSEQTKKCYDSLILAKAWLGKILQELGEETPYVNDGKRKTIEDIESTADKANMNLQSCEMSLEVPAMMDWSEKSHIEKIDWLRQEIILILNRFNCIFCGKHLPVQYGVYFEGIIIQYLTEARFWLGFELQRIRESSNN